MRLIQSMSAILALSLAGMALMPNHALAVNITLHWTAPGDDGLIGRAQYYDMRYSVFPIGDQSFTSATPVLSMPLPSVPGHRDSVTIIGLNGGLTYYIALRTRDAHGNWSALSNVLVVTRPGVVLGVGDDGVSFSSAWPNPANESAHFSLTLAAAAEATVEVFDMAGREVRHLAGGMHQAGSVDLSWDLTDDRGQRLGAGIYLVRARALGKNWARRVAVVK